MRLGIIITAYNRPFYLEQCLKTVAAADLSSVSTVMIVDDHSSDPETIKLINDFVLMDGIAVIKAFAKENKTIKGSLLFGLDILFKECDAVMTLDADAIVRKDFVRKLLKTLTDFPDHIVTGFNCQTKNKNGSIRHKVISIGIDYNFKKTVGGINMFFGKEQYEKWVRPALVECIDKGGNWDYHACLRANADGFNIACVVPSVVQHIGIISSMGHSTGGEPPDVADDFVYDSFSKERADGLSNINYIKEIYATFGKKLSLPNVTLVGADCVDINRLIKAADISEMGVSFGDVKMLSSLPSNDNRVLKIRHLASKSDYSTFMMKELANYIDTDFMLVIQYDGFVLNPGAFREEWFGYDYIGAPWEWYTDGMNVGNGGFSLRSRRLMQAVADDKDVIPKNEPGVTKNMEEDHCICRLYYQHLKYKHKIRFAPIDEARKFSIEGWKTNNPKWDGEFGFHGHSVDTSKSGYSLK